MRVDLMDSVAPNRSRCDGIGRQFRALASASISLAVEIKPGAPPSSDMGFAVTYHRHAAEPSCLAARQFAAVPVMIPKRRAFTPE
jgi:hypothetical protein